MSKSGLYIRLILLLIIVSLVGFFGYQVYNGLYGVPGGSPEGEYVVVVESGDTFKDLSVKLEEDEVIESTFWFSVQAKLESIEDLQVGEYKLDLPANPKEVINQINEETNKLALENAENDRKEVEITFKEGVTLDQIISELAKNGLSDKDTLEVYAKNPSNFDRSRYEFLPEPLDCTYGILSSCAKYYPEGYLYPDTYRFFVDSTPKEIFEKFLSNFETKVWSEVKTQVQSENIDFHKAVIMASVIEKETGRPGGFTKETLKTLNEERRKVAAVFLNRMDIGMSWGSDVTLEYGHNRKLCQESREISNCIYINDPLTQTKYNTYKNKGYPIGPVSNAQYYNIYAALNPSEGDYLYFLADTVGQVYFFETEAGFNQGRQDIIDINAQLQSS